jgi:hypothetical protein
MLTESMLEYALSLARDLAHSWPSWPPSILSVCNSSINLTLYEMKQSAKLWANTNVNGLQLISYTKSKYDNVL